MKEMDLISEKQPRGHPHFPERQVGFKEPGETQARRFHWAEDVVKRIFPKTEKGKPDLSKLSPDFRATVDAFKTLTNRELTKEKLVEENERLRNLRREGKIADQESEYLEKIIRSISAKMARLEVQEEPPPEIPSPEQPPPAIGAEVAPAPDVDPIDWYVDKVNNIRFAVQNVEVQRQKIGELLRSAKTDEERRKYQRILHATSDAEKQELAKLVLAEDLMEAKETLAKWEIGPGWSKEKKEKARLVVEVIAPIVEYQELWKEAMEKREAQVAGLERGQFDTVRGFFASRPKSVIQRREKLSFDDLIVWMRADNTELTFGDLTLPNGDEVAKLEQVQNISNYTRQELTRLKDGYQREFGTAGQALESISVSDLPKNKAEQAFRKYFENTMYYLESDPRFPDEVPEDREEARFRLFLQNLDPALDEQYDASKKFNDFFREFESGVSYEKIVESKKTVGIFETMLRLIQVVPGFSEAVNLTQTQEEIRYFKLQEGFLKQEIKKPEFWRLLNPPQRQGVEVMIQDAKNRYESLDKEINQFRTHFEKAVENGDEVTTKRALQLAQRFRRVTGLSYSFDIYRSPHGVLDDPYLKAFQWLERMIISKRLRSGYAIVGTGFDNLFGGWGYHFWDAYGRDLIKYNLELPGRWQPRTENGKLRYYPTPEQPSAVYGLSSNYVHDPEAFFGPVPIDWTKVDWKRLVVSGNWKFTRYGVEYLGEQFDATQLFDPWYGDFEDIQAARRASEKILNRDVITLKDVAEVIGKYDHLHVAIQRRIERFYYSLTNSATASIMIQLREDTGDSIFTNETAVKTLREPFSENAFAKEHFETYLSFIKGPDGTPKYSWLSELATRPLTLQEGALMVLNLLGGDVRIPRRDANGNIIFDTIAEGRRLIEAFLNRDEETGELVARNNHISFEEFAAFAGLVIENGKLRPAKRNELRNDGTAYLGVDQQGRRLRLKDAARDRIIEVLQNRLGRGFGDRCSKITTWMDIQEHILSKGAKLYLGLDFAPGEELEQTLQRYYQIIENVVPQLGRKEIGPNPWSNEDQPITERLIEGADPLFRILHGNWFEWRNYTTEERAATERLLPLRLHWDPKLTVQEAWIELGPTMLEGRVEQPWTKNPTPQDWREVFEQLERPEEYNLINRRQRELLEIQFNCTQRNVTFWQAPLRGFFRIPDEKGELATDRYFEPVRRVTAGLFRGGLGVVVNAIVPSLVPPTVETFTQGGFAALGGLIGALSAGPGGAILGVMAGWGFGNDWDNRSHWFPAGWGRWLLSRSWARRNTIPGTGITIGVWDWPYKPEGLAKIFGDKRRLYP